MPRVWPGCVHRADMSWFSCACFGHLFCIFPSSFLSLVFFSLFSFFSELPFSILHFLVSSSCYFFFSDSSMVDYFAVRVNCPSIAFFFTHLGSLLEFVEGECLERISFFVGEDYPYTTILSSLFPLVSHSAKVARSLKMSKVRYSDLEMRLSLSNDRVVSYSTSVSIPYKA